ncbi:cytochrome b5-like heme/steroid binding domain-containing protein [Cladochytrium replicatum]|nr:cytochrome b5-like heme/steroid binding domain-containing protein [Cladochytrium replicatum]
MAGISLSASDTPLNPGAAKGSQTDVHGSELSQKKSDYVSANQSVVSGRSSESSFSNRPSQIFTKSLMPLPPSRPSSSSLLSPISAHSARQPKMTPYGPGLSTESSQDVFPTLNGPQILSTAPGVRRKVPLGPGHSALDWAKLKSSGADLRGGLNGLSRFKPSMLTQHRTKDDCWMAVQGKVYNVTPYLRYHPGGVSQLMRGAGRDATELYLTIHPWVNIDVMLDKCFLGYLVPEPENS